MSTNRIDGAGKKAVGAAKEAVGKAVGDRSLEVKGKVEKAVGSAQNALGKAEDKARDAGRKM